MNTQIKILVRILLTLLIVSGFLVAKQLFAVSQPDVQTLSRQYNFIFAEFLIGKIKKIHKNTPVVLFLKDGSEVHGIFKGYSKYDDSVVIKEAGSWLEDLYGINELQDISTTTKEPV